MSIYGLMDAGTINIALKECLEQCWGVDKHTAVYICTKLSSLDEYPNGRDIINEFITKSELLNIDFTTNKEPKSLPKMDAVLEAPKEHKIVFENPYVRILLVSVAPGEREPFHVHAWHRFCIVMKSTTYKEELENGTCIEEFPVGFYDLPGGDYGAYTNVGEHADESLLFEIKD